MEDAVPASGKGERTSRRGSRAVALSRHRAGSPDGSLISAPDSGVAARVIPADETAMIGQYNGETIAAGTT
jgi:hypothetical protein